MEQDGGGICRYFICRICRYLHLALLPSSLVSHDFPSHAPLLLDSAARPGTEEGMEPYSQSRLLEKTILVAGLFVGTTSQAHARHEQVVINIPLPKFFGSPFRQKLLAACMDAMGVGRLRT